MGRWLIPLAAVAVFACSLAPSGAKDAKTAEKEDGFVALFEKDGVPEGWVVRAWNDVSKPPRAKAEWVVKDGVLRPTGSRGTWLMSEEQYGDFILEYEVKLSKLGNSGLALRAPMKGDPAFDGMELQMADFRYNTRAKPSELTGGIYRAIAPIKQVYKPTQWNRFRVVLRGPRLKATLNGVVIHDTDLREHDEEVRRHDRSLAQPVKDRPRRGHIGFQHLSRDGQPVLIRKVRIKVLDAKGKPTTKPAQKLPVVRITPELRTYQGRVLLWAGSKKAVLYIHWPLPAGLKKPLTRPIKPGKPYPVVELLRGPDVSGYARPSGAPKPPLPDDRRYSREKAVSGTLRCTSKGKTPKGHPRVTIELKDVRFPSARVELTEPIQTVLNLPPPP